MKRLRRIYCRARGHAWASETIATPGTIVSVPVCARCGRVDVENISIDAWSRKQRRRAARDLARRLTR